MAGHTHRFKVERIEDQTVTLKILDHPGEGKRWMLKRMAYGVPVTIGKMLFVKAGATNKTMKVRAAGYVEAQP